MDSNLTMWVGKLQENSWSFGIGTVNALSSRNNKMHCNETPLRHYDT